METTELKQAIESLLFITDHPLPIARLSQILGESADRVSGSLGALRQDYEERGSGVQVLEIAEGFQMATRPGYAGLIRKLYAERMVLRLSTASLETLSIIAYKQPLTRAEIEEIRGVEVIAALETLLEKRLVRVVGRKETVGRPLLYGTTPEFLRHFGFKSLEELPSLDASVPAETASSAAPEAPRLEAVAEAATPQAPCDCIGRALPTDPTSQSAPAASSDLEPRETGEARDSSSG